MKEWWGLEHATPKHGTLAYWIILSWRNLRNSEGRKDSLTTSLFPQKQVISCSGERYPKERIILISKEGGMPRGTGLAEHPPPLRLLHLAHTLLFYKFFQDFLLFFKPSIKTLRFNLFFWSSFPYEGSRVHVKIIINKFMCFSLVNLFFVRLIYWES